MQAIDAGGVDPLELAFEELSDLGNAERLKARFVGKLIHVPEWGWLAFDGKRWTRDEGPARALMATHDVVRGLRGEAIALNDAIVNQQLPPHRAKHTEYAKNQLDAIRRWQSTSGGAGRCRAMLEQATALMGGRVDQFDTDLMAINVANGTLRLVDAGGWMVKLMPHEPADLMTKIAGASWDEGAICPLWEKHLETVLPDPEVREFFQRVMGYALCGMRIEQVLLMLQGRGGDGKSTTMAVIRDMFGDYGIGADVKSFMAGPAKSGGDVSPDIARLAGDVRLCSTAEPKRGASLDENKVKEATGDGTMVARELHGKPFEFVPRFLLTIECNAKPRIAGDDDGIWRRVMLINFPHQFGKDGKPRDKTMKQRLLAERDGILKWAVDGLIDWLNRGDLAPPAPVLEAVEEYRRQASPFGNWFEERCDTSDPLVKTEHKVLRADYDAWCDENDVDEREKLGAKGFSLALSDRQIRRRKIGTIWRVGIKLRTKGQRLDDAPPAPPEGREPNDHRAGGYDDMEP